jgi:hypothetical protein
VGALPKRLPVEGAAFLSPKRDPDAGFEGSAILEKRSVFVSFLASAPPKRVYYFLVSPPNRLPVEAGISTLAFITRGLSASFGSAGF